MKKTTYTLIVLIAAGLLFAFAIPLATWLTFRSYNTQFTISNQADIASIRLPLLSCISISRSDHCNLLIKPQLSITTNDTATTTTLKFAAELARYINTTISDDTMHIAIAINDEFISDNNLAFYADCQMPIDITLPANAMRSLSTTVHGDYTLTGIETPSLEITGALNLNMRSCSVHTMRFHHSLFSASLHDTTIDRMTINFDKNEGAGIKCTGSALIDTIVMRPAFDGNILNLREARVNNVLLRPSTDCGCIEVSYGPETIHGALSGNDNK